MTEQGLPPRAGGMLDQPYAFLDACAFIWSEQAKSIDEQRRGKD